MPRKPKTGKGKKNPKSSSKIQAIVKDEVKKLHANDIETKSAYWFVGQGTATQPPTDPTDEYVYFNSQITSAGDMMQIVPNITKGVNDYNRIGDQVKAQSLIIKGILRFLPMSTTGTVNTSTFAQIMVRMMVVSSKIRPNYPDVTGSLSPLDQLLKKGSLVTGFKGNLSDIYAPINTDLWTLHHNETFYLTEPMNFRPDTAGLTNIPLDLKDFCKTFTIKMKVKNKILKYEDNINGGRTPTNYGPVLLIGYSYLNDASGDSISTNLGLMYHTELKYEDA